MRVCVWIKEIHVLNLRSKQSYDLKLALLNGHYVFFFLFFFLNMPLRYYVEQEKENLILD